MRLRSLVLPDRFIDHGTPQGQLAEAGLDARGIVAAVMRALGAQRPVAVRAGARLRGRLPKQHADPAQPGNGSISSSWSEAWPRAAPRPRR